MMNNPDIQNAVQGHLLQATKAMEDQLDAEIERLDKMEEDDFETLRVKRMENMKKAQMQKQEWMQNGHGQYSEVPDEKAFFDACKKSKRVVCHFYRDATFRCKIIDKHLGLLAPKHVETRFIKIDAEKAKFLVERLRIVVLPTVCIAKEGKTQDYIVGFDDLGGKDDFPTEMLEWRLGLADAINYQGDLTSPPVGNKPKTVLGHQKKTIRGGVGDDDSSDEDW